MTTYISLLKFSRILVEEINDLQKQAEVERSKEYAAAVKIQSWYRKIRTKYYIRLHLNKCAIQIQRCWRGYTGRRYFGIRVCNLVMIMRMNLYNAMAVRIQKVWRGFIIRKHTHNFYARKRYLEALAIKNEIVRSELREYQEKLKIENKQKMQLEAEQKMMLKSRKQHYLVSTHQCHGIYNSPFREYPHEMEFKLRSAKHLPLKRDQPKDKMLGIVDPTPLPPIAIATTPTDQDQLNPIQGPFKALHEAKEQRYRPLNPSLRVATDYRSLQKAREQMKNEEWTKRLHDIPFVPFSKRNVPYQPLLHTSSKYGHLPYGTKYFIEEKKSLNITNKRMKTSVSPIPLFDKFKQTYSKGSVVLQ